MEFVPESKIEVSNTSEIASIINSLPISTDMTQSILSYNSTLLPVPIHNVNSLSEIESFWVKLGIEVSNLKVWGRNCWNILNHSFAKSKFNSFGNFVSLTNIKSHLDSLICEYYPRNKFEIETDEVIPQFENGVIPIIKVFYNEGNIIEYPISYELRNKKHIYEKEKIYILEYIRRLNTCLNYLENNIHNFPVLNKLNPLCKEHKIKLKKEVQKLKKKVSKVSPLINELSTIDESN